jgi:hypothetical protein
MTKSLLTRSIQIFTLAALTSGCSSGSPAGSAIATLTSVKLFGGTNDAEPSEAPIPFHGTDHSCVVQAQVGGPANLSSQNQWAQLLFRKNIDYGKVSALFQASGHEAVRAIQSANVALYKGDGVPLGQCPQYSFLPSAPGDIQGHWIGLARMVATSEGGGRLLGLYLAQGSELGSTQPRGAMIVPADTTKWTIIHEYMHHEFDLALRASGQYRHPDKLRSDAEPALQFFLEAFKTVPDGHSPDAASAVVWRDHLYLLGSTLPQLFLQFYLEEITIEHTLSAAFSSGQLRFVPDLRQDARGYMSFGYNKVDQIAKLYIRALRSFGNSPGAHEHMNSLTNMAQEILRLRDEALSTIGGGGFSFQKSSDRTGIHLPHLNDDEHDHGHRGIDPKIESGLDDLF